MTDESVAATHETVTSQEAEEACQDNVEAAEGEAPRKTLKGGLDPAEMARRRWAKDRQRKADEQQQQAHEQRDQAVVVRVPVDIGRIVTKLASQAAKGGVAEARELRAYLSEFPVETDTDISALDRRTRQALLAMLIDDRLIAAYEDGSLDEWLAGRPLALDETSSEAALGDSPESTAAARQAHPRESGTPVV